MPYAVVVVDVFSLRRRSFHYSIPADLAASAVPGARVIVPLGKREVTGVITALATQSPVTHTRDIKTILDEEPAYSPRLLALADEVATYYVAPVASVLAAMLPAALRYRGQRLVSLLPGEEGKSAVSLEELDRELISLLLDRGVVGWGELKRALGEGAVRRVRLLQQRGLVRVDTTFSARAREKQMKWVHLTVSPEEARVRAEEQAPRAPRRAQVLRQLLEVGGQIPATQVPSPARQWLLEAGLIALTEQPVRRAPAQGWCAATEVVELNPEQRVAVTHLVTQRQPSLLHGVTGSGKTEVYMRVIEHELARGRQAIVLVPEIALTPQTVGVFRRRFGEDIAVLHSALALGERFDEWHRIRRGEARVVIGARSAVFAPTEDLGAIVVDEEHENSYKQEETPRYHARDVARLRARQQGALLILGSATPSLETYYQAEQGHLQLLELPWRAGKGTLPPVTVVDMRQQMQTGNRSMFSCLLQEKMAGVLSQGARIILFLNRRGYASFMLCRECGTVIRCPQCEVSLTLHARNSRLRCHYCDFTQPAPENCPHCRSSYIRGFGAGTERLEAEVKRLFPQAQVWRMDADTTTRRGAHQEILEEFSQSTGGVLLGTQMIAKGLDIPQVQLVGIVTADTALNLPDFRAAERTFQLVSQVAGRSGRDGPGEVLLQTYHPDHYAIQTAARHDYAAFYQQELALRQEACFPPFAYLARLLVSASHESSARAAALALSRRDHSYAVRIMGPAPAPISRLHGLYRWQLVLHGTCRESVQAVAESMYNEFEGERRTGVRLALDLDPVSMM